MTYSESSDAGSTDPTTAGIGPSQRTGSTRPVGSDENASTAVVLAVAAATGEDPIELTPPLHDLVDPDALDSLADGQDDLRIEFEAYGCHVAVEDGTVDVRRRDGPA